MFRNRETAGRALFGLLQKYQGHDVVVLGIPRGGVAVGFALARELHAPLDIVTVRKLPLPQQAEAGFGAIGVDGGVVLNEALVRRFRLTQREVDAIVVDVRREVERREQEYRQGRAPLSLNGKVSIVVDDGLASGYTMLAAIGSVLARGPKRIAIAVPCASAEALGIVRSRAQELYCIARSDEPVFAVASFYDEFPEMTDDEVRAYLERASSR